MIAQTLCTSFKQQLFLAVHNFSTDTFKMALYTANANLGADTTVYTPVEEVPSIDTAGVANAILQAAVYAPPGYALFRTTTVGGRALGDITNDSTVTSADALAYQRWAAGVNTNSAQIAWIEGTLNPYMFANPISYAAYINSTYSAGGITLTGTTVSVDGTTAYVDFANAVWNPAAFTCRGALIYNASKSNKAVAVLDFGADKTASTLFTVVMPANTSTSALIRLP